MDGPNIPKVVKPRRPHTNNLSLLIVTKDWIFSELQGNFPASDLPLVIKRHPSAIVGCVNPPQILSYLHEEFADHPLWQFRISPLSREKRRTDGTFDAHTETLVNFFGFKRANGHGKNRYFYPISPLQFCREDINGIVTDDMPYDVKLYQWLRSVVDFCEEYELRPSPTSGGLAAQLLRHPLFYGEARRKVPKATNEKVRNTLPGNCYELRATLGRVYPSAILIDQRNAHHWAAENTPLPHADELLARGRFRNLDSPGLWLSADRPDEMQNFLDRHIGLLHARVSVPPSVAVRWFIPAEIARGGERDIFVYTNELADYLSLGVKLIGIRAAWTSIKRDYGIYRYSQWSQKQIAARPKDKGWLKPTLLSSYGILAAKPRHLEFCFWQANSGDKADIIIGPERVEVMVRRTDREIQSPIANVIQRGMIEAETRRQSLKLARDLTAAHFEVLSVYADAVIIREPEPERVQFGKRDPNKGRPRQLPILAEPWRVKERLTWLRFLNPQAYQSRETTKMPGTPKARRQSGTLSAAPKPAP